MALPQYDMATLISDIKLRCTVPTSQLLYSDERFTFQTNRQLKDKVIPLIMSAREEYFVDHYLTTMPPDGVIPFPGFTVGIKLRSVCYVQQGSPLILIGLPRIDLDVIAGIGWNNYTTIAGFYVEGNNLCLYPNPSLPQNTPIRIYFYKRTLVLATPGDYAQITAIDSGTNTLTLTRVPSSWIVGTQLNSISQIPNFDITKELMTVVSSSTPTLVVDSVDGMAVGDYVSEYGYTPIPQIPIEAFGYLAQLTASKVLESIGDRDGMKTSDEEAKELKENLLIVISQRVDGAVKKIIAPKGGIRLGAGLGRWGRGSSGGTF